MLELFGLGVLTSSLTLTGDMSDSFSVHYFNQALLGQRDPISVCDDDAVVILPLIHSLENSHQWIQNWYADESSCVGELLSVRKWYDRLLPNGPAYGFFPEPSKTVLVVQSLAIDLQKANDLFYDLSVCVVIGSWFFGVFVGEQSLAADFVSRLIRLRYDISVLSGFLMLL